MDLELRGKTAIVTGASRGIGRAIAESLAREGCDLAICARGEADLAEARARLEDLGATVESVACDVTDDGAVESLVERTVSRFGGVDVLVGNVGGNRRGDFESLDASDWREIWALNVESHVRTARAVLPSLRERGGAMVFVASIYGRESGGPGLAIYNSTKSALLSMARVLALEVAGSGVRVNTVAPGSIRFPGGSWDRRCREQPDEMAEFIERELPLGRFGRAEEVADVVAFLCSARASLVTGACWTIDGGQSHSLI